MNEASNDGVLSAVKKYRKSGFLIVSMCVLACSAPVLIALLGFGGLSTAASVLPLPPVVRDISLTVGISGFLLVTGYLLYRLFAKGKS